MADYTGKKCIVCKGTFSESDDIVVCPECGTPYHRECYAKTGSCINTELHNSKGTWQPSPEISAAQQTEAQNDLVCRRCGYVNPENALFCERCGEPMPALEKHNEKMRENQNRAMNGNTFPGMMNGQEQGINIQPFLVNFSDPLCGYNPDEDFDGVRLCELGDYVETNTHYYLPIFKRIKETGKAISWNFSAMIFPELYFANRKMPLMSAAAFILRLFTSLPGEIYMLAASNPDMVGKFIDTRSSAFSTMLTLSYFLSYVIMFFFGSFANWIYYKKAVKKTAKIKKTVPPQFLRQTLRSKGGTSIALLLTVGFICLSLRYIIARLMEFGFGFGLI